MPRPRINKEPLTPAECSRRYREKLKEDQEKLDEHKAKEKARKAAWYAANKEKKAEAQRRYRKAKRGSSA